MRSSTARARSLSTELGTTITPGFEALVFKASRGIEDIYELTYIRKDGSRFPAVVSVTALREAAGAIIGYLLIGADNTARQLVEDERLKLDRRLRDQHFYNRSLLESNIDALMTTDTRGIITDVNKPIHAEGFLVVHAVSAEAALDLATQQPLSLITLDIMLPGMDGWDHPHGPLTILIADDDPKAIELSAVRVTGLT